VSTVAIGERIQECREAKGWSQSELARRMVDAGWATYSQVSVSRTEKGEREPRLAEAITLAEILKCNAQWLILSSNQPDIDLYAAGYRDGLRAAQESIADLLTKGE